MKQISRLIGVPVEFWFVLLTIGGYIIVSGLAIPLGIEDSRLFAVPYRVLICFFSFWIIWRNFSWQKIKNISIWSFFLFWIYYLCKVFYSHNHDQYDADVLANWNEIYARIGLIVIFPSFALMLINYKLINFRTLAKWIYWVFLVMLTLNFFYGITKISDRFEMRFIFSLYYISYGHLAASLAIMGLFFLLFGENKDRLLAWYSFFLGCFSILVGGARGPFLALGIVAFYLLLVKRNWKLLKLFVVIIGLCILGIWIFGYFQLGHVYFLNRTYLSIFEGDTSERGHLYAKGIEIFKNHIWFGGRIIYENGIYQHNLFLELLSATGIFGFLLYFLKFFSVYQKRSLFMSSSPTIYLIFFFALFLQYFVFVLTSGNLYLAPDFVHLSALMIGIALSYIYEETKSNDGSRNPSRNNPPL